MTTPLQRSVFVIVVAVLGSCGASSPSTNSPPAGETQASTDPATRTRQLEHVAWSRLGLVATDVEVCHCSIAMPPSWQPVARATSSPKQEFKRLVPHESLVLFAENTTDVDALIERYKKAVPTLLKDGKAGPVVRGDYGETAMTRLTAYSGPGEFQFYFFGRTTNASEQAQVLFFAGNAGDEARRLFDRVAGSYSQEPAASRTPIAATLCYAGTEVITAAGHPEARGDLLIRLRVSDSKTMEHETITSGTAASRGASVFTFDGPRVSGRDTAAPGNTTAGAFSANDSGAHVVMNSAALDADITFGDQAYRATLVARRPEGTATVLRRATQTNPKRCDDAVPRR